MAITHTAAVRNQICDDMLTQIGNAGYLRLEDGGVLVSQHTFPTPTGTVTTDTLTFTCGTGISDTTPAAGTIDGAKLYKSGATEVFSCTAGTAGDVVVSSATIATTDTVTLTALTYEAPA